MARPKRSTTPIRDIGPFDLTYRSSRLRQQSKLASRIEKIDRQLANLGRQRSLLAEKSRELQNELYPPNWSIHGRAPEPHAVGEPLPPVPEGAEEIYGRRLRTVCLRLLQRLGRCSLRFLHSLLHLHGYAVEGANPVKTLADALGHEADAGRAVRVARGVYEPAPGLRFRARRQDRLDDLVLPYLAELDSPSDIEETG